MTYDLVAGGSADPLQVEGEAPVSSEIVLPHLDTLLLKIGDEAGIVGVAEQDDFRCRTAQLLTVAARVEAMLGAAVMRVATSSLLRVGGLLARASSTRTLRLVVTIHLSSSTWLVSKNFDESRRERISFSLASTSHVMLLCSRIS